MLCLYNVRLGIKNIGNARHCIERVGHCVYHVVEILDRCVDHSDIGNECIKLTVGKLPAHNVQSAYRPCRRNAERKYHRRERKRGREEHRCMQIGIRLSLTYALEAGILLLLLGKGLDNAHSSENVGEQRLKRSVCGKAASIIRAHL